MQIEYRVNTPVTPQEFTRLLNDSFLGERRPVDDPECMAGMIENANLVVSAWDKDRLVGISRCVTDFHYACYLSDLAVHREYQKAGIGRLIEAVVCLLTRGQVVGATPSGFAGFLVDYMGKVSFTLRP